MKVAGRSFYKSCDWRRLLPRNLWLRFNYVESPLCRAALQAPVRALNAYFSFFSLQFLYFFKPVRALQFIFLISFFVKSISDT